MRSNIETLTTSSGETFSRGTYNGISVLIRDKDGFINASKLGNNSRRARDFIKKDRFKLICEYWMKHRSDGSTQPQYTLSSINNEFKGMYIHPDLVHFVAEWVDIEYAFIVADIMNSINNKVHDVLEKQHLQDTVENAKPVFNEAVKRISLKIDIDLHNSRCWGVRDDIHRLDSYERDDLQRDIDKYNNIKKQLDEARNKLREWNDFIPTYHPNFEY